MATIFRSGARLNLAEGTPTFSWGMRCDVERGAPSVTISVVGQRDGKVIKVVLTEVELDALLASRERHKADREAMKRQYGI